MQQSLVERRKSLGRTQQEIGILAGFSQMFVSLAERGFASLDTSKKHALARALDADIEDIQWPEPVTAESLMRN